MFGWQLSGANRCFHWILETCFSSVLRLEGFVVFLKIRYFHEKRGIIVSTFSRGIILFPAKKNQSTLAFFWKQHFLNVSLLRRRYWRNHQFHSCRRPEKGAMLTDFFLPELWDHTSLDNWFPTRGIWMSRGGWKFPYELIIFSCGPAAWVTFLITKFTDSRVLGLSRSC